MVEDAESLLVALQEQPEAVVDVSGLVRMHMAVAQIVLALKPAIQGTAGDPFLAQYIWPNPRYDSDNTPQTS